MNPNREANAVRIEAVIRSLPQARVLREDRIAAAVDWLSNETDDEAQFHLRRLAGWGGSEIGVLVAEHRGDRDPLTCHRHLAMDKLLLRFGSPKNEHMARGTLFEALAQSMLRKSGLRPDLDAQRDLRAHLANPNRPLAWAGSSPDDILLGKGGKRLIPDYKVPAEAPTRSDPVLFRYVCQVHHYRMVLAEIGVPVDHLCVANLVFPSATALVPLMRDPVIANAILRHVLETMDTDRAVAEIVIQPIAIDDDLTAEIKRVGAAAWDDIIAGNLPAWPARPAPKHQLTAETVERVEVLEQVIVHCSLVGKSLASRENAARDELAEIARTHLDSTQSLPVSMLSHQRRETVNWDAAASELVARGCHATMLQMKQYDSEGMANALLQVGLDPEQFARHEGHNKERISALLGEGMTVFTDHQHQVGIGRTSDAKSRMTEIRALAEESAGELVQIAAGKADGSDVARAKCPAPC